MEELRAQERHSYFDLRWDDAHNTKHDHDCLLARLVKAHAYFMRLVIFL